MYHFSTSKINHRYLEKLQDIVKTYNATPNRSLNSIAPKDANNKNEASLWAFMSLKLKKVTTKKKLKLHFKINDYVRISHKSMIFDRSYNEHSTQEICKVRQRFRMQRICM